MSERTARTQYLLQLVRDHGLTNAELASLLQIDPANARSMRSGCWVPSWHMLRLLELELSRRENSLAAPADAGPGEWP